jgi:SAM-dependent methyltransferase
VACTACGLTFADIANRQSDIDASYEQHSIYAVTPTHDAAPPWDVARLSGVAQYLATTVERRDARILDAGCATGTFLGLLKERGFTSLWGLDPSAQASAMARRLYGVEAIAGSFVTPPPSIGRFDLVTLQHVLEHISDVRGAVDSLFGLLVPGGLAYIEVPDATRYVDHLVAPYHDFNTEHINHFSISIVTWILERAGFQTLTTGEKVVRCAARYTYPAIFGLWRRPLERSVSAASVRRDESLVSGIDCYIAASGRLLESIDATLRSSLRDDSDVIVWGAGQLSMKLMRDTVLADKHIAAIVDGSTQKHGLHMHGTVVVAPAEVRGIDAPIVVTSIHSADEIRHAIERELGVGRRILTL